jgi:phage gpG-like protein
MADPTVRVEGLRELNRDLKRLEPETAKLLRTDIRAIAERVATEAREDAVRRTGAYAGSIRVYVTQRGASIGSRLPQAGVLHFGGTIRPRGVPIVFPARPVISQAVDRNADRLVNEIGDAIEQAVGGPRGHHDRSAPRPPARQPL